MTTEPTPDATTDGPPTVEPTETNTIMDPVVPAPSAPTRGVRTGTVVWGFVLALCGVGMLAAATGVHFDLGLAAIVVLGVAGLVLLIGSMISAARHR